jgi:uncharacterized repeat protein (TIGR02543 family)
MAGYSWTVYLQVHSNFTPDSVNTTQVDGFANVPQGSAYYAYVYAPANTFTREGFNFLGYAETSTGAKRYNVGDTLSLGLGPGTGVGYIPLYCVWQAQTFTVSYNANGGSNPPAPQTKTYGTDLALTATVPTRTNYTFRGWATSSTGSVVYQPGGTYTANESVTLYAIWAVAAGTLNTVSDTDIGSSGTATWTKVSEAHTYKLVLSLSGATSVTIDNISAGTSSASFTIPATWYNALPNSTSATATAGLYSYDSGALVGSSQKTFTVSVASSINPTISAFTATPHSDNSTAESWAVAVQGYSYITLSVTATAGTGATVSNITFTGHGISQSSTETTGNTAIVTSTGSQGYTVTVTDSRGRSSTSTVSVTVYEYANPSISSFTVVRCLSNGTQSDTEGNYIKALPVFVFSSVNSHNSLTVNKIEYKAHDSSTWLNGPTGLTSGAWCTPFGTADVAKAFDVRFTITDSLGNTFAIETIVQSVVGFALGLKNDRARFGGPVKQAGLEIDWDVLIHGDLTLGSTTLTEQQLIDLLNGGGGGGVNIQQDANGGLSIS